MKANYLKLAALALFVLALNAAALAQDFGPKVRAQVPFSFHAGAKVLPAGSYTFAVNRQNRQVTIFQNNKGIVTFLGSPYDGSKNGLALLTFRTNGEGAYALQKLQGSEFGLSFNEEKVLSRWAENRTANPTQVVLAKVVR